MVVVVLTVAVAVAADGVLDGQGLTPGCSDAAAQAVAAAGLNAEGGRGVVDGHLMY